jgi:hypothetical protein
MSDMTGVASDSTWFSARYHRDATDLTHSVASDMRAMHMRVTGEYAPKSYQVELPIADRICCGLASCPLTGASPASRSSY